MLVLYLRTRVGKRSRGKPWIVVPGPAVPSLLMVSTKRGAHDLMESMKLTWPDRQGTDKAVCVVVACSAFALAGVLDPDQDQLRCWWRKRKLPRGVEDRVRGRTMGAGVPSRPRSSQTFQMWAGQSLSVLPRLVSQRGTPFVLVVPKHLTLSAS